MKGSRFMHHYHGGSRMVVLLTVITLIGSSVEEGLAPGGGDGETMCLDQLMPCLNYLISQGQGRVQDPPDSCCNPLKSVLKSEPECLCGMISNQGAKNANRVGINVTQAQELPGRCGQSVNPISCLTTTKTNPGVRDSQNSAISEQYSWHLLVLIATVCYMLHS